MRKFLNNYFLMSLALFILLSYAALAKPISLEEAKEIAMQHNLQLNKYSIELQDPSAYKLIASSNDIFSNFTQNPTFYIYNFPQEGWVIVAGDDIARPILAYSKEGSYSLENLHDNAKYWLEQYDLTISEAVKQGTSQSEKIANEWLVARNPKKRASLLDEVVPPLIKTKWGQWMPYNDLCPYDEEAKSRVLTGCVATSMAQIMNYWNFPENGIGEKTYTHPKYGELYADFENITYDWENMTNEYNQNSTAEQIQAVATLMYHCGVAVSMNYGVEVSLAYESYMVSSLKIYFMYDDSIKIVHRSNYDDNTWTDILKKNLDNSQPMEYAGFSAGGGHSFICDGYDTDGRFHFNLGWGGQVDGYYDITNFYFNQRQSATINIRPSKGAKSQVALLKPLELQQEIVYQNSAVKINANIVNNGSESFSGKISLRLFDMEDNFLMTIAEQEIDNLEVNKPAEIAFETNPLFNISASKYYVKLYYKHDKLNHWLVSSGNNKLELDVQKPLSSESKLSLYSSPILSAYRIDKEKESNLKATASFINTSETDFKGIISASIYNETGTIIKELASHNVTEAIAPNNYIKDIDFSNSISDLDYGIYFIGFRIKDEEGEFAFVNTNNFISFIKLAIVPPDLITDPQLKRWIKFNTGQLPGVTVNEYGEIYGTPSNLEALAKIENLDCSSAELRSIDELSRTMPNLKILNCELNYLTKLDINKNVHLEKLFCWNNQLMDLDISKNMELVYLDCDRNQLNNLDISKNINLTILYCSQNQLNNLDLSNSINLTHLYCNTNQLSNLDLSNNIELVWLYCDDNRLIKLDISKNINLRTLDCSKNQLSNIDLSKNINLRTLNCSQNQLSNLDLSNNIELIELYCYDNQLSNLDLSQNINLTELGCSRNQLNNLDLSQNINLTGIGCSRNQLSNLDLSNNIELTQLVCHTNQLSNLDISPLAKLYYLSCCTQAEGFILYLTKEQKNIFNEEHYCDAILKEKDGSICEIEWLGIYPNPTAGKFFIDNKFLSDEIKILNLAGEVLYRSTLNFEKTEIDISNLPAGVYFVITKGKIGKVVKN